MTRRNLLATVAAGLSTKKKKPLKVSREIRGDVERIYITNSTDRPVRVSISMYDGKIIVR